MEDDAGLARLAKVQTAADDEIKKVVRRIPAIERGLEMITCHEKFLAAVRRGEGRALRVVGTAGQKLQSEERMGRPAFAQIDFNRIRLPCGAPLRAGHDKIEREAPDHSGSAEDIACGGGIARDRARIGWIGRKDAAEITLSAR